MKYMNLYALLTAALLIGIVPTLHAAELTASDGASFDRFGIATSQSGNTGLVGSYLADVGANSNQGAVYVFQNLNVATGFVTQNAKLIASDGAANTSFGLAVGQSGTTGLVGAYQAQVGANTSQGAAYLFRDLDTASGMISQDVKLVASDGAQSDFFGRAVSQSGGISLVGAYGDDNGIKANQGSAYVFRVAAIASGTLTQNVKLTASDGLGADFFGYSVSQSGTIGLVGAYLADIGAVENAGAAYVFRSLDTASGSVTQNVKLIASDRAATDVFGKFVSLSGSIGIVGAAGDDIGANADQGSAYIFRNLDTVTGTVTQNVKLIASDGAGNDQFGSGVSQSGAAAVVGAPFADIGSAVDRGAAYVFLGQDSASGTMTESLKLTASDGVTNDRFGDSVTLDGDQLLIGASNVTGMVGLGSGRAYTGSLSAMTTLDTGNTSKTISGISFTSQDDWIIGQTTDSNQVTLSAGDGADVTATGKVTHIGQNAGSDNNTLLIDGMLVTNEVKVGAAGNTGNLLTINGSATATSGVTVASGSAIGGDGTLTGNLSFLSGGKFIFSLTGTLTVTGSVSLDSTFGIDDLIGLDSSAALGTYTLINGTSTDFSTLGLENWGSGNAYDLGSGKSAYFSQGSLMVNVIPEPGTLSLLALGLLPFFRRRRTWLGDFVCFSASPFQPCNPHPSISHIP